MGSLLNIRRKKLITQEIHTAEFPEDYDIARDSRDKLPMVKYLVISKLMDNRWVSKTSGRERCRRFYGIGILTDDNSYYYNELYIMNDAINKFNLIRLKRIILNRYNFSQRTKIVFSDNIARYSESMTLFFDLMAACFRMSVYRASLEQQLRTLNNKFRYIKPTKHRKFSFYHRKMMIRRLFEMNRFEFITDSMWEFKLKQTHHNSRHAQIQCAIGILYAYCKEYNNYQNKKSKQKKNRLTEETLRYNKTEDNNLSGDNTNETK